MKIKVLIAIVVTLFLAARFGPGAETNDVVSQISGLVMKIQTKLRDGPKTEQDLAPELKAFDDLLAAHKGEKSDEMAQVLLIKALVYAQFLDNTDKAKEAITQLQKDFAGTETAAQAGEFLTTLERQAQAKKIQATLVSGARFPEFNETDLAGKPLSLAKYKGKVVLIDFWATWCGPCIMELPNVRATYDKYHRDNFEIIGVSLDSEREKLDSFIKKNEIAWPQYFDGQMWSNKLAMKYGIMSIPATFLVDAEGKIIDKNLRGDALDAAVAKAVKK